MAKVKLVQEKLPNVVLEIIDLVGDEFKIEVDNDEAADLFDALNEVLEDEE